MTVSDQLCQRFSVQTTKFTCLHLYAYVCAELEHGHVTMTLRIQNVLGIFAANKNCPDN